MPATESANAPTTRMPEVGTTVTFVAPDGHPFVGVVIKSYGFAVAVADALSDRITVLESGTPWARVLL